MLRPKCCEGSAGRSRGFLPLRGPMNVEETPQKTKEAFLKFTEREDSLFNYEKQVFENHFERLLRIYDGKITPPYEVEIQPSSVCNVNCVWCVGRDFKRLKNLLTREHMAKIAKEIINFEEDGFGVDTVKFSGFVGEPLLNPATVEGLRIFSENGKRVGLFTNGMLLDEHLPDIVNISYLHLSLDAGSQKTFKILKGERADFVKVMSDLKKLVLEREKRGTSLEIGVGYIISPENYHEIPAITSQLKEYGVDFIRFKVDITGEKRLTDISDAVLEKLSLAKGLADEKFKVLVIHQEDEIRGERPEIYDIHKIKGVRCYLHKLFGAISSDGCVYSCDFKTYSGSEVVADLKKCSFRDAWLKKNDDLPNSTCVRCPPMGVRINKFLTFLFGLKREEIIKLHEDFTNRS